MDKDNFFMQLSPFPFQKPTSPTKKAERVKNKSTTPASKKLGSCMKQKQTTFWNTFNGECMSCILAHSEWPLDRHSCTLYSSLCQIILHNADEVSQHQVNLCLSDRPTPTPCSVEIQSLLLSFSAVCKNIPLLCRRTCLCVQPLPGTLDQMFLNVRMWRID